MRILKLLGLAFFATLALSAIGAFGAGSASALLFLTTLNPELFTIKNVGPLVFETRGGNKVECEIVLGHGFVLNKTDITHLFLLTFHKCASTFAGPCTSPNQPQGLITTLELDALLVTLLQSIDKYGLLLLAKNGIIAEFTCSNALVTVKAVVSGSVVGEFEETLAESEAAKKEVKVKFAKGVNPGEPAIKSYWTLQGIAEPKLLITLSGAIIENDVESNMQVLLNIVFLHTVRFCHN